jgi:lantibiotic leader peptide-processing serine protease
MRKGLVPALLAIGLLVLSPAAPASSDASERYIVVLEGRRTTDGFSATSAAQVRAAIGAMGGSVTHDLTRQIGVLFARGPAGMDARLRATAGVVDASRDVGWKGVPTLDEAVPAAVTGTLSHPPAPGGGGPDVTEDPLEPLQWSMRQIRAPQAHAVQAGWRAVDVGILDTGIDGRHADFFDADGSNVDCARGRDSVFFGPGVGNPDPCTDNGFHGTHVAGIVGARANEQGIVGVAPNVTLVPVKVCDAIGYCYASSVVDGITYAGDMRFDVINMSFFVDDDSFLQSHEYKCMNDPVQRTFRRAVERAVAYARMRGVVPVAALGNSDNDLAHPPEPYENQCDVVPAETQGVIGTMSLGPRSEKARYSNYGVWATDVGAPGGNGTTGDCNTNVLSTTPGNSWECFQGTSMASPHAAGVAALIVSQYGRLRPDGDVEMRPQQVEAYLQGTAVDIGLPGYDECFGNGRVDAVRAVSHTTARAYDSSAPFCPEYAE